MRITGSSPAPEWRSSSRSAGPCAGSAGEGLPGSGRGRLRTFFASARRRACRTIERGLAESLKALRRRTVSGVSSRRLLHGGGGAALIDEHRRRPAVGVRWGAVEDLPRSATGANVRPFSPPCGVAARRQRRRGQPPSRCTQADPRDLWPYARPGARGPASGAREQGLPHNAPQGSTSRTAAPVPERAIALSPRAVNRGAPVLRAGRPPAAVRARGQSPVPGSPLHRAPVLRGQDRAQDSRPSPAAIAHSHQLGRPAPRELVGDREQRVNRRVRHRARTRAELDIWVAPHSSCEYQQPRTRTVSAPPLHRPVRLSIALRRWVMRPASGRASPARG